MVNVGVERYQLVNHSTGLSKVAQEQDNFTYKKLYKYAVDTLSYLYVFHITRY